MKIDISKSFEDIIQKTAEELVSSGKNKISLERPFDGFYVSTEPPEDQEKMVGTFKRGGTEVFLVCENIFGEEEV